MSIVEVLAAKDVARVRDQASAIAASAEHEAATNQFIFFAAFDGTNNDKDDVALSGNPQDTNVAQLFAQAASSAKNDPNMRVGYYPGPGSKGSRAESSWLPRQVTRQAVEAATRAYDDCCREASSWLKLHPGGSVTAMMTSFSRGGASAAIFSQMLWERGLADPNNGKVLVPPGKVGVTAGLIYDPVDTGVTGNLAFAPNVRNITVVHSLDERRSEFRGADYTGQPGVTVLPFTGNHCDIGGGYDNGLGALSLEAGTAFLRKSGLPIADVAEARRFDPTQPVVIHTEGVDDYGHRKWSEDNLFGYGIARSSDRVVTATMNREQNAEGEATHFTDFSGARIDLTTRPDGGYTEHMTTRNGRVIETSGEGAAAPQPRGESAVERSHSSEASGEFDIYGIDAKGNIHPSLVVGAHSATERYVEQWCDERVHHAPAAAPFKNAG